MKLGPSERKIIAAVEQHHGADDGVVGGIHVNATIDDYGGSCRLSDGIVRTGKLSRDRTMKSERGRIWRQRWAT